MSATSVLQVLKVNDLRTGEKNGKPWSMRSAECILLDDKGQTVEVGVLDLPRHMLSDADAPKPGTYIGTFVLKAFWKDRRIMAELVELQPYKVARQAPAGQ